MGKHRPDALAPRYLEQFRCIGSACPESCCTGWTVSIDKASYQQYRQVKIEPLATLVRESVQRIPDGTGRNYARIRLGQDSSCPLLDEQKLCRIHSELGEKALSRTCSNYPRIYGIDDDRHIASATLSCPESARLALTEHTALDPITLLLPFANAQLVPLSYKRMKPADDQGDPVLVNAKLIAHAVDGLVRVPTLNAAQSLVQAGLMLRRLARIEARGQAGTLELARTIEHYLAPQHLANVPTLMNNLPVQRTAQLSMLFETTQRYLSKHGGRPSFVALINDVQAGLKLEQGLGSAVANLDAALHQRWSPLEAQHPQLLKNYLLNDLTKSLFPRQDILGIEREFMDLALRFALIKFYLLGLAALRGPDFGIDDVVRVVYVVVRNIEHNNSFMTAVMDDLAARDALRLDVLATLVL